MSHGFVYVLSNPAMPGIYKIGMTERSPHKRAEELSCSTSVPASFIVEMYVAVPDMEVYERDVHDSLSDCRVSNNREFFRTDPLRIFETVAWLSDTLSMYLREAFDVQITHERENQLEAAQRETAAVPLKIVGLQD